MLFNQKEKLPNIISGLFLTFICLLSVSYDNKLINNLFYLSSILYLFYTIKNKKIELDTSIFFLIPFLAVNSLSMLWSDHARDLVRTMQHSLYILLFFLIMYEFRAILLHKNLMLKLFSITSVLFVLINGYLFYNHHPIEARFYAEFGPTNTIDYAGILCIAVLFNYYLFTETPKKTAKAFYLALGSISLLAVFLSQSRTPLIGLFIALFILSLKDKKYALFITLSALTVSAIIVLFYPELISRDSVDGAPTPRIFTWIYTLQEVISKHPWFGFGYNNTFAHYFAPRNITYNNPHSVYMSMFFYTGFVGALTFCALVMKLATDALALFSRNKLPLSILVFGLIFCSTQGYLYIYHPREIWLLLWFPLALIPAIKHYQDAS
ncbi:MAG: O-antigen ligase family protein [Plesiomonas sp.]